METLNCGHQSLFIIYDTSICVIFCLVLLELTTLIDVGFVFSVMFDSKFLQSDQSILSIFLPLEKQNWKGFFLSICWFPCMFVNYLALRHLLSCINECCLFAYYTDLFLKNFCALGLLNFQSFFINHAQEIGFLTVVLCSVLTFSSSSKCFRACQGYLHLVSLFLFFLVKLVSLFPSV